MAQVTSLLLWSPQVLPPPGALGALRSVECGPPRLTSKLYNTVGYSMKQTGDQQAAALSTCTLSGLLEQIRFRPLSLSMRLLLYSAQTISSSSPTEEDLCLAWTRLRHTYSTLSLVPDAFLNGRCSQSAKEI